MDNVNMVTGSTPDDELIHKILVKLGVDPGDWSISLSGIYAAIRCNMQIGEPHMSKVEDWTDAAEISEDTLTGVMFKLVERAKKAEETRPDGYDGESLAGEIVRDRIALATAVGLTADDVLGEDIEVITERIAAIIAERDQLKAGNGRMREALELLYTQLDNWSFNLSQLGAPDVMVQRPINQMRDQVVSALKAADEA